MKKQMPKTIKSRDPSWKTMQDIRQSGAMGAHRDKKKEQKYGYEKHKGKTMDESIYTHPAGSELSRIGRILMDKAITTKDDALSNVMSRVGSELTMYGEAGGASSIEELEKKTKLPKEKILKLMKWATQQKDDTLSKVKDPEPSKDDDDEKEESIATETTPIGHVDDERNMIRKELYQMATYAKEMFTMLEKLPADSDFPHWWQAKVVNSLSMISKAKHYLENEINVPDVDGDRTEESHDNMGFSDKEIKMAYGVLNDPRYKGGNMTGAVATIEKIAKGLSKHPGVQKALQRTNESVCSECGKVRFTSLPEEMQSQYENVNEEKQKGVDGKVCWKGYKRMGTKMKGGKRVDNCVKM